MVTVRRSLLVVVALTAVAVALPAAASAKTVWLCKPGLAKNPCTPGLTTTAFTPSNTRIGTVKVTAQRKPPIDCFYVYPTVSDQKTPNANLTIDPQERSIALYQAARYSQHCRVFAPMYRQGTLTALNGARNSDAALAYGDVRAAWNDYLRHDNRGRGVVLLGHSQGSFVLRSLITKEIDPKPALRRKLVGAQLLGGNVLVKQGTGIGGDFQHIPACVRAAQLGCVVAYSTYNAVPPADAIFGKGGGAGQQVLCTNPAALGGGSGTLNPIYPSAPFAPGSTLAVAISLLGVTLPTADTTWITVPGAYRARCSDEGGANVLRVEPLKGAPVFKPSPTASWGLHLEDTNIALGNLVGLVQRQSAAYVHRYGAPKG